MAACSAIIPREKHDVFLSFRGEDTRYTFTSHLNEALCRSKIQTYIDHKLERGDDINPALLEAISNSKLSIIIFSKNYASSTWCLDELVHILQCRDSQFVIPIFYGVDPSDVRKQSGSYADAFVEHEKHFEDYKLVEWRKALTTAANISGFDPISKTISSEADLVKLVVDDVLAKLNRKSQIASGLEGKVGLEKHVRKVESLLCLDSHAVRTVGIWGMGGIGKTTIADAVYHRLSSQFKACCFIPNVREASETRQGLNKLRDQLLCTILKEDNLQIATPSIGSMFVSRRLSGTKALVVLDDVSDLNQVEFLVGVDCILFGPGSRIIVTARNKRVLGVDDETIYKVEELDCDEALDLFHLRALRNLSPTMDYSSLSREVVDYAGGNPLALTVLGSVFSHCKSKEDWKGELDKLKKYPDKQIQNVLRFSYYGLGKNEKDIFLDIACFHKGEDINEAKRVLEACGFSASAGVRLLTDLSLISVDKEGSLQMHDLIQEMGREIVRDQCDKNPGKRSRLWLANEIRLVLKNNKGTEAIECIVMNMDDLITDLYVNAASFEKMDSLRLLNLYSHSYTRGVNKVHLPPGFDFLPEALKYLRWDFYPLPYMPLRFSSENLVELHMPNSQLVQLWNKDVQIDLGSLKCIDLSRSKHLAELPDLSGCPNLESISLEWCSSLVQLPSSFQHHTKLTRLWLNGCSSLKILPRMPGSLEVLLLQRTGIEELPSSIWSLEKLEVLGSEYCKKLKSLPSSTCRLNSLLYLDLYYCLSLESLPVELPSVLVILKLSYCKRLGSLTVELPAGLKRLYLNGCESLKSLALKLPSGLKYLNLRDCENLVSLPVELPSGLSDLILTCCKTLGSLPVELPAWLRRLYLRGCKNLGSLPKLPWFLLSLDAHGCTSLKTVSSSMRTAPLQGWDQYLKNFEKFRVEEIFDFSNCLKLDQTARSNIMSDAQFRIIRNATASCDTCPDRPGCSTVLFPGNEIPRWLKYRSEGCSIHIKLPPNWFRQGFLGYALCVVFQFHKATPGVYYCFRWRIDHDRELVCFETVSMVLASNSENPLNSDHVLVWYFCPKYVGSSWSKKYAEGSEASFYFEWCDSDNDLWTCPLDLSTARLKRCGVSLLYAQDLEKLFGSISN